MPEISQADPATVGQDERFFHLDDAPGFLLRQLESRATALFHEFSAQTDITPRQFGVLLTLLQGGRLLQTELGRRMCVDRSTLGEMLQRMLERGLVKRQSSQQDRRTATIELSSAGRQTVFALVDAARCAQAALIAPLPEAERPRFLKQLSLLATYWQLAAKDGVP